MSATTAHSKAGVSYAEVWESPMLTTAKSVRSKRKTGTAALRL
jgi:hypothetical protein